MEKGKPLLKFRKVKYIEQAFRQKPRFWEKLFSLGPRCLFRKLVFALGCISDMDTLDKSGNARVLTNFSAVEYQHGIGEAPEDSAIAVGQRLSLENTQTSFPNLFAFIRVFTDKLLLVLYPGIGLVYLLRQFNVKPNPLKVV